MRLAKPFYRLPVRFDAERLRAEVAALPASAWAKHPNEIPGNSSVRLISVDGGENDDVNGVMQLTPHLKQCPYMRQVLASFGVVWSRSRLLRLAPGACVPEHADINYHWYNRIRLHIPIVTRPEVRFYCGDQSVHMAAGEAWVFDNWRLHRVENPTPDERIHLVADTSGSAAFWQFVGRSEIQNTTDQVFRFDPSRDMTPLTERTTLAPVMAPAEVDLLILDLITELVPRSATPESRVALARYTAMLDALRRDWRQLYALYGDRPEGWPEFTRLRDSVRNASRNLAEGLMIRTNQVAAHTVLEGRLLRAMLNIPETTAKPTAPRARASLRRPIFIVAAPRSGSTLLFETLAASENISSFGDEAHWLVEGIPDLRPGAPGVESNRLEAYHATDAIGEHIIQEILRRVPDTSRRFLEKTPKNALRIPFFDRIFPDAQFIFLWRDPRENLSSIIEAWRSGQWKTYNGLDGFDGPWSMLLPPGWRAMRGQPLEKIAAFQWATTNTIALDDLEKLPRERWTAVSYADLLANPEVTVRRLCEFLRIEVDPALAQRITAPLPHSRYTLTPPAADKWRANEALIERVLPEVQPVWNRLLALNQSSKT